MSLATVFGLDVEGVGAVEVDVILLCRCQVCRILVCEGVAVGTQRVERVADVGRGPQHRGVGDQRETERLIDLVIEVSPTDVSLVGEEQIAAQRVQPLALVQLPTDPAAEFFVSDVTNR